MDILAHAWLAMRLPLLTRLTHVLSLGLRGQQSFLKLSPAFSSTRDNEAGRAVTFFSAASLAASSGIVMSGSAATQSSRTARCAASLPLPGRRP